MQSEKTNHSVYPKDYWKRIIFTFCTGWVVIWIYRSMLSPVYSEIQQTVGPQSNAALGLIASFYFFGYTALQIPSGVLVDKFGQKKVLIPAFLIFAAGVAFVGFASTINMIYAGAALAGIGSGCYYGAAFSMTAQHVPPEKKGLSTAIVNSGSALGMILGMMGSSFFVHRLGLPWQVMTLISFVLIILMVIWFATMLISPEKEQESHENIDTADGKPTPSVTTESKGSLFRLELVSAYILYFTTCYAYYLIITWLPDFLANERGVDGSLIGIITSMIAVTAVPGALYFSNKSDKNLDQKSKIVVWLSLASFVLISVSMLAPNEIILSIVLLLYGFLGKMAIDPVLISYVSDRADDAKLASTLGLFNFFGMSSSVVAPTLTGIIIDSTGSGEVGFYIGAAFLLIGTIIFVVSDMHARKKVS